MARPLSSFFLKKKLHCKLFASAPILPLCSSAHPELVMNFPPPGLKNSPPEFRLNSLEIACHPGNGNCRLCSPGPPKSRRTAEVTHEVARKRVDREHSGVYKSQCKCRL